MTISTMIDNRDTAALADALDEASLNDDVEVLQELIELLEISGLMNEVNMEM